MSAATKPTTPFLSFPEDPFVFNYVVESVCTSDGGCLQRPEVFVPLELEMVRSLALVGFGNHTWVLWEGSTGFNCCVLLQKCVFLIYSCVYVHIF